MGKARRWVLLSREAKKRTHSIVNKPPKAIPSPRGTAGTMSTTEPQSPCSPLAARCKFSLQFWEAKEGEEVHLQLTGIQAQNAASQCAASQFDLRPQTLRDKVCL